jgi:hypothetical protein
MVMVDVLQASLQDCAAYRAITREVVDPFRLIRINASPLPVASPSEPRMCGSPFLAIFSQVGFVFVLVLFLCDNKEPTPFQGVTEEEAFLKLLQEEILEEVCCRPLSTSLLL